MPDSDMTYIPETPGGTLLINLEADTEEDAWMNLLEDAKHMPYQGIKGFKERGYRVHAYVPSTGDKAEPDNFTELREFTEHDE